MTKVITCPHCGCDVDVPTRSGRQHRRFFKMIAAAYQNWPEAHAFQPDDSEHLRAWLLVKAGWSVSQTFSIDKVDDADMPAVSKSLVGIMLGFGRPAWFKVSDNGTITGHMAKSISYPVMGHQDACRVFSDVESIVEGIIGASIDDLLKEAKEAA